MAPTIVGTPSDTSGKQKVAPVLAITKSQNRTPVSPYPMQGPCTAAMVGLNNSIPLSKELIVGFSQNVPPKVPTEPAPSLRSPPAQKTSPLAVRIPTQASR